MVNLSLQRIEEIAKGLGPFIKPGSWHELRGLGVPNGYRPITYTGWFSDIQAMAKEAARLDQLGGNTYMSLNPTIEALAARAENHLIIAEPKKCTDDSRLSNSRGYS